MKEISVHIDSNGEQGFSLHAMLALPCRVTTAAWLLPGPDKLHILINTGTGAAHLEINSGKVITELPAIDAMIAGAVVKDSELIVTTAGKQHGPTVAAINTAGKVIWEHVIEAPAPLIWPQVFITDTVQLVWQEQNGLLETATVDKTGISQHRSYPAGDKPLCIASAGKSLFCIWKTSNGIGGMELTPETARPFTAAIAAKQVAAAANGQLTAAVLQEKEIELLAINSAENIQHTGKSISLQQHTADGILSLITGTKTVAWLKKYNAGWQDNEEDEYASILLTEDCRPFTITGLVHHIVWWNGLLAVLGSAVLYLLKPDEKPAENT